MSADYFLPKAADHESLSGWSDILPPEARVLRTNLFGDAFLVDALGAVHMLERAACTIGVVAASEEEFWRKIDHDEDGWQLRPLLDECRSAGKVLEGAQCYTLTTPPLLGGDYTATNVSVAPWREWFEFTANLFKQTKNLPEGTRVSIRVTD
jgi:hypothetical protein